MERYRILRLIVDYDYVANYVMFPEALFTELGPLQEMIDAKMPYLILFFGQVSDDMLIPPAAFVDLLPVGAGVADTLVYFSSEEGRLTSTRTLESYPVQPAYQQYEFLLMKTSPGPAT